MMEIELHHLMLESLDGNAASYQLFLRQVSGLLRAYLRRRLSTTPDEVEDLLQDTLLAIHSQRHTYKRNALLSPWLYAIARYKLIDYLRRRARHEALHDPLDEEAEYLRVMDDDAHASSKDLTRMLAELPEHQRLPIVHTKLEGRSVAETAGLTGMSVSAVKVGVHRGMKALAKIWKEQI